MIKNNISRYIASFVVLLAVLIVPQRAAALTLELALVIDGSSSISSTDWDLQIGAYKNIFQNNFYSTYIAPSQFDQIAVAAYVFSGGNTFTVNNVTTEYIVSSFSDWSLITNDTEAQAFGNFFSDPGPPLFNLPQPSGQTNTSTALDIAVNGGQVSCPIVTSCFPVTIAPPFTLTATGLLNNIYTGDRLVIDISTDGVPTLPTGSGTPNQTDRDLAITAADNARAAGITVNALGVGGVDATFLDALVGINPSASPTGFVELAPTFGDFNAALIRKIGRETVVPVPAAVWLFGSGLLGLIGVARRRSHS